LTSINSGKTQWLNNNTHHALQNFPTFPPTLGVPEVAMKKLFIKIIRAIIPKVSLWPNDNTCKILGYLNKILEVPHCCIKLLYNAASLSVTL